MSAVEFETIVKNGTIEIPHEYREHVGPRVRVLIWTEERKSLGANIIEQLLENPVELSDFVPMSREAAHER